MYSTYQIIKILKNCFRSMSCFSWIKLILVLIHLKYWYYNSPYAERPYLPHHICQILPQPAKTFFNINLIMLASSNPLQHKPHHVLRRFQYCVLLHLTKSHHKYWIYQIIYKAKPIKFVIKLYKDHGSLWVKHATRQKTEALRTAFPSNLGNMINNSSNFNTENAEFSTKWLVLLHFQNPSCGYNQSCNLYQGTVLLLQSSFTSLFHPYLFTKSLLQSPLTLPFYITQQFFTSLFLRTTIPTIYTKNIFPTSNILPIQAASRY